MKENVANKYSEYTLGLALLDAVPVILFMLSGCVLYMITGSALMLAGVVACFAGGAAKVLWKFLVVLRGADYGVLTKAFHVLMPAGFTVLIAGLMIRAIREPGEASPEIHIPVISIILLLLCVAGFCYMGYMSKHIRQEDARANWIEEILNTTVQAALLAAVVFIYLGMYYPAGESAQDIASANKDRSLKQNEDAMQAEVAITNSENYLLFDGQGDESAIIFYPGAQVEPDAYAPLAARIASEGTDFFICKMPYDLALFDEDAASEIAESYDHETYFMAGHSLGGVAASSYLNDISGKSSDDAEGEPSTDPAENDETEWGGLILLASYPTDKVELPVISIYGSEDGVLNRESYTKVSEQGLWPDDMTEIVIDGGNHAQFGDYGPQKGDGNASISAEEQQNIAAAAITAWIKQRGTLIVD